MTGSKPGFMPVIGEAFFAEGMAPQSERDFGRQTHRSWRRQRPKPGYYEAARRW
jgi:hypothetical protein